MPERPISALVFNGANEIRQQFAFFLALQLIQERIGILGKSEKSHCNRSHVSVVVFENAGHCWRGKSCVLAQTSEKRNHAHACPARGVHFRRGKPTKRKSRQ